MRIVLFDTEPWECPGFKVLEEEHDFTCTEEKLTPATAEAYADAEVVSTFIYSDLSAETLKHFSALKLIATRSTGFDHIDLDYCREAGIAVANVPSYGEATVAEHVFALLLCISHRMDRAIDRTRRGDFSLEGLQGFDLEGKVLGIIGTGDIGRHVARVAQGFQMEVLAFDVSPDEEAASELGFRYVDWDTVLAGADIVTLHVPGNPKTRHLMDEAAFAKMKDGAVLINTARGDVVEMRALVHALAEGKLAAAGLDVLPEEPVVREEAELLRSIYREQHDLESLLADHVIMRLRNVVLTPHSAFNTREATDRIVSTTVENMQAFARGEGRNLVVGKTAGNAEESAA